MSAAGEYRHRITIEAPTRSDADDGQRTATWNTHARLWAKLNQRNADQEPEFGGKQSQGERTYRFEVRQSEAARAISHTMRLIYRGRTLGIAGVDTVGSLTDVVITATEKPV